MNDLKHALIIELLRTQSHCDGGLVRLSPQTKLPALQIEI